MARLRLWALGAALLAACSTNQGPSLHLAIAHGAAGDYCVPPGGVAPPDEAVPPSTVRISVRVHGMNDPAGSFLCDANLTAGQMQPTLNLATRGAQSVDLFAEEFQPADPNDPLNATAGPVRRVATGQIVGIAPNAASLPTLRMFPTQAFRCAADRLHQARAFHSATLLPDGEVLIVGGVVAGSDPTLEMLDANQHLYLTGSAEVWNPVDQKFYQVMEAMPPSGRAFHQAALLNDTPPYQVLLVGGITTQDGMGSSPVLAPNTGALEGSRLVPFDVGAVPTPLPAKAAAAEILVYDPATRSATRMPAPGIAPGAFQAGAPLMGGIAVAGGIDYGASNMTDLTHATDISVSIAGAVHVGPLSTARVGATLSPLFGDTALVWGGGRSPADSAGDLVTTLTGGSPAGTAVTVMSTPLTQFHTATVFGATSSSASVLVTGGFLVGAGAIATQPPPADQAARVLTVTTSVTAQPVTLSGYSPDTTCTDPMRYRPAGWESAVALPSGGVLVTGGAATFSTGTPACNDCENGASGLFCSLHQASLFTPPGTLGMLPAMQVGRFGHSSTLMGDGTVLIVGGLSLPSTGSPRTVGDAEVYNPRAFVPPWNPGAPQMGDRDDPLAGDITALGLVRAPGDVARDPMTGAAAKPCGTL